MGVGGKLAYTASSMLSSFKDVDFKDSTGTVKCHVGLSSFGGRFKEAQIWLDNRIMLDMQPYIPFRTGALQGAITARNNALRGTGKIVVYTLSYGRKVYYGRRADGSMMRYSNPLSTPEYFKTVRSIYEPSWKQGVEEIIKRK